MSKRSVPGGHEDGEGKRGKPSPSESSLRMLCPAGRCGFVIGKGGSTISAIRKNTGARVIMAEEVPGCPYRVVGVSKDTGLFKEAVQAVFQQLVDPELSPVVHVLVPQSKIGVVLGKGGATIAHMRAMSGADMHVQQQPEMLPACATPGDALLVIEGPMVGAGLDAVADVLLGNRMDGAPQQADWAWAGGPGFDSNAWGGGGGGGGPGQWPGANSMAPPGVPHQDGAASSGQPRALKIHPGDCVFELLCPDSRAGTVIGKAGAHISQIRKDTGAKVQVAHSVPGCPRVVTVIANELQQAIDSVSAVVSKISEFNEQTLESFPAKFVVTHEQSSNIIGKAGCSIKAIRSESGASVTILQKERVPAWAGDSDIIEVFGDEPKILAAVRTLVAKMFAVGKSSISSTLGNAANANPNPATFGVGFNSDPFAPPAPYYDFPPQQYTPAPHMEDPYAYQPAGLLQPPAEQQAHRGGHQPPASAPYFPQQAPAYQQPAYEQAAASYQQPSFEAQPHQSSLSGGALLKLAVPNAHVGALLGKGGSNVKHMRLTSGANIKVHQPVEGEEARTVEISGSTPQVQAVQNMVHEQAVQEGWECAILVAHYPPY